MNFQGERDFTPYIKQYQRVISFLLYIQGSYPDIFKMLEQAPQFEYEIGSCRHRLHRSSRYLSKLKRLVREYERGKVAAAQVLKHRKTRRTEFEESYYLAFRSFKNLGEGN